MSKHDARLPRTGELSGWSVILTRPVGMARAWQQHFQALGAQSIGLPGLTIRPVADQDAVRQAWLAAQNDPIWIFTSPVAVACAARLQLGWPKATVLAVGAASAKRLQAWAAAPIGVPTGRQDSEGLLALPILQQVQGQRIAVITGANGRGLLQQQLRQRGAEVRELVLYQRQAPRWDRRHLEALRSLPSRAILLLSSAEALRHLQQGLPAALWQALLARPLVVSSPRLADLAQAAGFAQPLCAASALLPDMQAAVLGWVRQHGQT